MRNTCFIFLTLLIGGGCGPHGCDLTASCDQTVAAGKPWSCAHDFNNFGGFDEPCNGDTCNPGFTCAVGTCVPCAGADEACCGASRIQGGSCNPGLTCGYDHNQDWYTCQNCGTTIGGACCPPESGNGCSVGMCMNGTCQDTSSNKCLGPNTYWVWIVDSTCASVKHGFNSGTIDDAKQCVAETLAVQFPTSAGFEIGPVGVNPALVEPTPHEACPTKCNVFGDSNLTVTFDSFSTAQLHLCEHNKDSTCMWQDDAACPGG